MRSKMFRCNGLAAVLLAAAVAIGCGDAVDEAEVYEEPEAGIGDDALGTTGLDYGAYDAEIGPFLDQYYGENEMFADDDIGFDVNEGVVSITGEVDTIGERDELVNWVNAVPGVRDVNTVGLTVAQ